MKRAIHASVLTVIVAVGAIMSACQTVERTFTGAPIVQRPVDVVYRFDNVKRTPSFDEWDKIRRVLYLHAKGSVNIADSNQRKYADTDLRDYVARFTVADASHIAKLNEDIDALAGEKVAGEKIRFAMTRAEVTFAGDNLATRHDTILRGVTLPAATVKLYPGSGIIEAQTDQYGAWAKRVSVSPGQDEVYGYAEGLTTAGRPALKKFFKINVFTMKQDTITEAQFNSRPKL